MRHPGTYLGLPMPDPTSSEFGKGTRGSPAPTLGLTGSGSRLRASQRDCSTTVHSPSSERHPPVSRRATAPLLWSVATPVASLGRSGGDGGRDGDEWTRVCRQTAARRFCSRQESRVTVHRRWAAHSVLGRMRPRRVMKFVAQAFTAFWNFHAGWVGLSSVLWAGYG
jgi:hypothetical protein